MPTIDSTEQPDQQNPNLHPCPDCGKLVSRKAPQCPNCGRPLIGKRVETRLTVGRLVCQQSSAFMLNVALDGTDIFSLDVGERGTAIIEPGEHILSVSCGPFIFKRTGATRFFVDDGEHKQISIDLQPSIWTREIAFQEVHFEGQYDYS